MSLDYYIHRMIPRSGWDDVHAYDSLTTALSRPELQKAARERRRLWMVTAPPLYMDEARLQLEGAGYRIRRQRTFTGQVDAQVVLAVPVKRFANR